MANILLVEDDVELSGTLTMVLASKNHQVTTALTGTEGLEQMRFGDFDAIILDGMLPDMDGTAICRTYRQDGGKAPVLMLTGRVDASSVRDGMEAGASAYLKKPFGVRELLSSLDSLLSKSTVGG